MINQNTNPKLTPKTYSQNKNPFVAKGIFCESGLPSFHNAVFELFFRFGFYFVSLIGFDEVLDGF